jgi:hypothetical protein
MDRFFERDRNRWGGGLGGISGCGCRLSGADGRRQEKENVCAGQQKEEAASATRTASALHNLIQDTMPKLKVSLSL